MSTNGQHPALSWFTTQIRGLDGMRVTVADMAVDDNPDLAAVRLANSGASCLLIDDVGSLRDALTEALHQLYELEVQRAREKQGGN
jgi:hypothetical protein